MVTKNKKYYKDQESIALKQYQGVIASLIDSLETETQSSEQIYTNIYRLLNDPIRSLIKKLYRHISYVYHNLNLPLLKGKQDNDVDELVQSWADLVISELIKSKCICKKNYCKDRHSLKAWAKSGDKDLFEYLRYALWGYSRLKKREYAIVEGMLFPHIREEFSIDLVLILFNSCGKCKHLYRGEYCQESCRAPFDLSTMKKTVRKWYVRMENIVERQVYHCKNSDCDNYYFPQKEIKRSECPIVSCRTEQPQRKTKVFTEILKEDFFTNFAAKATTLNTSKTEDNSDNKVKNFINNFYEEVSCERPWMWALMVCLSQKDLPGFIVIEQLIQNEYRPTDINIVYEMIESVFTEKSPMTYGKMQEYLRDCLLELKINRKLLEKEQVIFILPEENCRILSGHILAMFWRNKD